MDKYLIINDLLHFTDWNVHAMSEILSVGCLFREAAPTASVYKFGWNLSCSYHSLT
jgi:hypothetical protein